MGREFIDIFDRWADQYDQTVLGTDEEYREVFEHYNAILNEVAERSEGHVLEFGTGTGNLATVLLAGSHPYTGVEPSAKMRLIAERKLKIPLEDGDFLNFSEPDTQVDTIVSTYAFHHLTDGEKQHAAHTFNKLLKKGGKVVFADTVFADEESKQAIIRDAERKNLLNLAEDLQTEYYPMLEDITVIFEKAGFYVSLDQMNKFVWILEAVKQ